MKRTQWFERKFPLIEDNGILPTIIERLEGTPSHIDKKLDQINPKFLTISLNNKWTIKEQLGHLSDLEPLWLNRLNDIINCLSKLTSADLTNQKTYESNHNEVELRTLQQSFCIQREIFVNRLRSISSEHLIKSSLHPRLKSPMRIIDLAYFVAEHDDHHLAEINEIYSTVKNYNP